MNDMHRAVHLESGKIIEVSSHIAKQPNLMLEYGYILQPLPDEDITEELKTKFEEGNLYVNITDDGVEIKDKSLDFNALDIDGNPISELAEEKPKRTYNKKQ